MGCFLGSRVHPHHFSRKQETAPRAPGSKHWGRQGSLPQPDLWVSSNSPCEQPLPVPVWPSCHEAESSPCRPPPDATEKPPVKHNIQSPTCPRPVCVPGKGAQVGAVGPVGRRGKKLRCRVRWASPVTDTLTTPPPTDAPNTKSQQTATLEARGHGVPHIRPWALPVPCSRTSRTPPDTAKVAATLPGLSWTEGHQPL